MRYIILIFLLVIVPLLTGLFLNSLKNDEKTLGRTYINGWISIFAVLEVVSLPAIYFEASLTTLTIIAGVVLAIIIVAGTLKEKDSLLKYVTGTFDILKNVNIMWLLAGVLIAIQMGTYFLKMTSDDDDAFYLATATTANATNTLFKYNPYTGDMYDSFPARYVLSPFSLLYSMLGKISGVHIAVIAHTLIPVFFVAFAYIVYFYIAKRLFKDDMNKIGFFLFFIALIFEFSGISTRTTGVFFLTRIWQGKALLASILIPLIMEFILAKAREKITAKDILWLCPIMLACCYASSMGILLGPLAVAIGWLVHFFITKKVWDIIPVVLACIPNLILAIIYVFIR
ncbi:MAG: hypothetical protein K6E13_04860 [Lachnospiraceae bacterium]|nr:hypothetical protein [Lachnospiraceae bacterium]